MEDLLSHYTKPFIVFFSTLILLTWLVMIMAVLVDLWTGVEKAKARGEVISSSALRRTLVKIGDYWRVQVFGLMVDVFGSLYYSAPYASMVVGFGILIIEARSVVENLKGKKSAAAELPDLIVQIIKAKTQGDASAILEALKSNSLNTEEDKKDGQH